MSFLEGAYSQVVAALQRQGRPNLRASDVPTGDREHSWAPGAPSGGNMMGPQVAQAIAQPNAFMTHRGGLELIGGLPSESRGYSPATGSSALRPKLPVADPSITRAVLSVTNADQGTANLAGEQGYAVHVEQGVARFDGPVWGGRWAKVDAVGSFKDTRAGELEAGVDSLYYYADATVVGDAKGRDLTDIPTRVLYMRESDLPAVGSVIFEGMRDQYGVGWGPDKAPTQVGAGKITTGWTWVTGQENVAGRITFNPTNAMVDGTADTTRTYSALALSGPDSDPNGQKDWVFGYSWDASGARIAITGNVYDEKIGSMKPWYGGVGSIPGGWALVTSETEGAERYIVGYKAGGAYATPGALLGSATVQSDPHAPQATSVDTTNIEISDHAAADVTTSTTHITIADHAADDVTSSTTHITIDDHASTSVSDETVVVDDHPDHAHGWGDDGYFISGIGGVSNPDSPSVDDQGHTSPVIWFQKWGFSDLGGHLSGGVFEPGSETTATTFVLSHSVTAHHHTTPVFTHVISDTGHHHTTPVFTHVITDPGHYHTTEILTHTITDPGHYHTTPTLTHSVEDNRPQSVVLVLIKRVGPDDD